MKITGDTIAQALADVLPNVLKDTEQAVTVAPWFERIPNLFPNMAQVGFSWFQKEFFEYVDTVTAKKSPKPVALPWGRGLAKSTSVEMAIADLGASNRRRFFLYVAAKQDKANEHLDNIKLSLEAPPIQKAYPKVGTPRKTLYGQQVAWRQAEIATENGVYFVAQGLDAAVRGIKREGFRPDCIIFDDIDDLGDGPEMVRKKLAVITSTILKTRAPDCFIIFAQNEIHAGSLMRKVVKRTGEFLMNAKIIGPVPAIKDIKYIIDGPNHAIITGGEPSWPEWLSLDVCQDMIDEGGLESFLTECQNDVDRLKAGAIYPQWNEIYHVVTKSEIVRELGEDALKYNEETQEYEFHIPGRAAVGHDWGSTMKHPAATVMYVTPAESLNKYGIGDIRFKVGELVRPRTREDLEFMTPIEYGKLINEMIAPYKDNIDWAVMSHEASSERNTYSLHLKPSLKFAPFAGKRTGGIAQMQSHLLIDYEQEHPFRRYPEGYMLKHPDTGEVIDVSGQKLLGRPRIIWVVDDGHGELELDNAGDLIVMSGKGDAGMERGRWERSIYHWDSTAMGTEKQTPYPLDNDVEDAERMVSWASFPTQEKMSLKEKINQRMKERYPHLDLASLPVAVTNDVETRVRIEQTRMMYAGKVAEETEKDFEVETAVRRPRARNRNFNEPWGAR